MASTGIPAATTTPRVVVVAIVMALVGIAMFAYLTRRKWQRGGEVVAADGSFELPAQTAGNGPDEDEDEKSGTPPSVDTEHPPGP